ncbi:MAG: sigma-54-dependent Fis family transcriptional regulator [Planctomycetes bacterium]|nr:sigma-54-dependent Fis family transcriptional regulator [Planctomycetota bacterium]
MTGEKGDGRGAELSHDPRRKRVVLVVDDDRVGRESLVEAVGEMGYQAIGVPSGAAALETLEWQHVDLVLTDLRMPDMDGLDLLSRVRQRDQTIFVMLITAFATVSTAVEAMKRGAFNYIMKPIDLDQLKAHVETAFGAQDLLLENISLRERLQHLSAGPDLIGSSFPMRRVMDLINQVADTLSTILIRGESGTGKELVANAIHRRSRRVGGPFVKVNCAALSESLLESELFGHEEGAFTGAIRQRQGRFELAHGGTIFLDEVSELAATTQAKLLRVLQNREFERLGGTETIAVDVRVIAATNADLEARVEAGTFRRDLYFRLNVVPVHLPPLRDRREDIPLFVHTFIRRYAERNSKDVAGISPQALQRLMGHDWPGNVRELENCIERMVVTATKRVLDVDDLPAETFPAPGVAPSAPPAAGPSPPLALAGVSLKEIEERAIRDTLDATGGNRTEAARLLGISLATLHRRIEEYGIARLRKPNE